MAEKEVTPDLLRRYIGNQRLCMLPTCDVDVIVIRLLERESTDSALVKNGGNLVGLRSLVRIQKYLTEVQYT